MTVQTNVATRPGVALPGQVFDTDFNDIVSGVCAGAFNFGQMVVDKGSGWEVVSDAGDYAYEFGVAIKGKTKVTGAGYAVGDTCNVLKRGRVAVASSVTFALGEEVRAIDSGAGTAGNFTNAAAAGETVLLDDARVIVAGTIPIIELQNSGTTAD